MNELQKPQTYTQIATVGGAIVATNMLENLAFSHLRSTLGYEVKNGKFDYTNPKSLKPINPKVSAEINLKRQSVRFGVAGAVVFLSGYTNDPTAKLAAIASGATLVANALRDQITQLNPQSK